MNYQLKISRFKKDPLGGVTQIESIPINIRQAIAEIPTETTSLDMSDNNLDCLGRGLYWLFKNIVKNPPHIRNLDLSNTNLSFDILKRLIDTLPKTILVKLDEKSFNNESEVYQLKKDYPGRLLFKSIPRLSACPYTLHGVRGDGAGTDIDSDLTAAAIPSSRC